MPRRLPIACLLLATLVAACGGSPAAPGITVAAPPPPPPPAPAATNFNTAEFRRNWGLAAIDALPAYQAGFSGEGVTVAVIDSGIDTDHPDLALNINPASRNVADGAGIEDPDGHGSAVAGVIAAIRNDSGVHGVAFNASLLVLRADSDGSCAGDDGCGFADNAIANGVQWARNQGAKVINISLGGSPANFQLRAAIRAAAADGILVVISAGNDAAAQPDPLALVATDPLVDGRVVIAGASDRNNALASFSNQAGAASNFFLTAPGVGIVTADLDGQLASWSGTSFAAPHVAGALALLIEAFPDTSPDTLLAILKDTAIDLGTPGVDEVFGWGLIDIGAALAPQGPQSFALDPQTNADLGVSGLALGPAFGDALAGSALSGLVFSDRYDRAFTADLEPRLRHDRAGVALYQRHRQVQAFAYGKAMLGDGISFSASATRGDRPAPEIAMAIGPISDARPSVEAPQLRLDFEEAGFDFTIMRGVLFDDTLAPHGLGPGLGATALLGGDAAVGVAGGTMVKGWRIELAAARETVRSAVADPLFQSPISASRQLARLAVGRDSAAGGWRLYLGAVGENGMLLGSLGSGGLALAKGGDSLFLRLGGDHRFSGRLDLFGEALLSRTNPKTAVASLFRADRPLIASAWRFGARVYDWLRPDDQLIFSITQPLRIESGNVLAHLPVARTKDGTIRFDDRRLGLRPSGREIDAGASYRRTIGAMAFATDLVYRHDSGHDAGAAAELALLVEALLAF